MRRFGVIHRGGCKDRPYDPQKRKEEGNGEGKEHERRDR